MPLYARSRTATNDRFIRRVTVAIVAAAVAINGEAAATPRSKERTQLAFDVLRNPETWGRTFAWGVAADPAIGDTDDSETLNDATIEARVAAIWTDYATAFTG